MPNPQPSNSDPNSGLGSSHKGTESELHVPAILRHSEALSVRTVQFGPDEDYRTSQLLERILMITKLEMSRMNRDSPGLTNDQAASLLKMLKAPSARAVLLERKLPASEGGATQVEGYGLIFTDLVDAPDKDEIPKELLAEGKVCRANRLFVTEEARAYGPRGEATTMIIDEFVRIAGDSRIVGKVLVGPETLAKGWFAAKQALEARGFEDSGFAATHIERRPSGLEVPLFFKWYAYPPLTDTGRADLAAHEEHFRGLKRESRTRVAATVASFPITDGRIACFSRDQDGYDLAKIYPGNAIINVEFSPNQNPKHRDERRFNLRTVKSNLPSLSVEPESLDGIYVSHVLADVARIGSATAPENVKEFLKDQVSKLKHGGRIILSDSFLGSEDLKRLFTSLGLRIVLASSENVRDQSSLIIGEKVGENEGVILVQKELVTNSPAGFLSLHSYRWLDPKHSEGPEVWDLVQRPNPTLDVVPWFEVDNELYVVNRAGYPRPIMNACGSGLDGLFTSGYSTEQVAAIIDERRISDPIYLREAVEETLQNRAAISTNSILVLSRAVAYFSSGGAVDEQVIAVAVKIQPMLDLRKVEHGYSNFSTSGVIESSRATQILAGCQRGSLLDARLERMVYNLLLSEGKKLELWLGERMKLAAQEDPEIFVTQARAALWHPPFRAFIKQERPGGDFLEIREGTFSELNSSGQELSSAKLQYVVPSTKSGLSNNTVSILPVIKLRDHLGTKKIVVGLEIRDLPAVQEHSHTSTITSTPAFRLPREIEDLNSAEKYAKERMLADFNLSCINSTWLGGKYPSSNGVTPEFVHSMLIEVDVKSIQNSKLIWVELNDLLENRELIRDGHTLTALFRGAHALGVLPE